MVYHIDGYCAFSCTDTGRGVIIYPNDSLNISPNQYLNSLYHDASWCNWNVDGKTIILGCIYGSPSDVEACDCIIRLINELSLLNTDILITDDFNYKDKNWDELSTLHENHPEYKFIECLRDNFLFQRIKHFTRCRNE